MTREDTLRLQSKLLERGAKDLGALVDAFELCRNLDDHDGSREVRKLANGLMKRGGGINALDLYKKTLLYDAPLDWDCAFLYAEFNRDPKKQFYLPRRKQLLPIVRALEDLNKRKIRLLGIMAPPGIGKTTVAEMAMVMMGKEHPELSILGASHSNSFLRGVYDEILRMLDPNGEYLFCDIFPEIGVCKTNAQDMRIDLQSPKRFQTFEFSSVGSGNAGKVRASNLLYADDLVDGIESALSRERMDKLFQQYHTDLRQRMIGDCVELLIQTPWSLHDPIDRLEVMYADDSMARFIHLPALDDNDESNFDYPYGVGFTTAFYHQQRDMMDDASWRALYMTSPVEREGQLYSEDELRRYFELPDKEPDAIISVCDTKDKGTDYCFCPIAYQYGNDYYIEDCVCDNSNPEIVESRLVSKHLQHNVQLSCFESNSAGGKVAEKVLNEIKARGGRTKITTRYTTQNKETKIIVNSPWVKEHCLFLDNSMLKGNKEYRRMLNFLTGYTMAGKNKNDDVPDGMAQFALYAQSFAQMRVEVIQRPW